jgi:hypothetical protein
MLLVAPVHTTTYKHTEAAASHLSIIASLPRPLYARWPVYSSHIMMPAHDTHSSAQQSELPPKLQVKTEGLRS